MKELPIADCRLTIEDLRAGSGFARNGHNGSQVIGFLQQRGNLAGGHNFRFAKQFQPERRLIGFFFHGSDFRDELGFASRATRCPVIGGNGGSAANDLFGNDIPSEISSGNCSRSFNDPKREGFGPLFEFSGIHTAKLPNQSPIANRQSSIPL